MTIETRSRPIIRTGEFHRIPVPAELLARTEGLILPPQAIKTIEEIVQTFEGKPPLESLDGKNRALPLQKMAAKDSTKEKDRIYFPVRVYQNGDKVISPTAKTGDKNQDEKWFTIGTDGTRIAEVNPKTVKTEPAYIPDKDGKPSTLVQIVEGRNNTKEYILLGPDGRPDIDMSKPKSERRPTKVIPPDPAAVVPSRKVDPSSGLEVVKVNTGELVREQLREDITDLVKLRCADLIKKTIAQPRSQEVIDAWRNIDEITTAVMAILNNKTINSIQRSHALNIADAGLQAATNPDYQISFVAGFGASDSPFTTTRYPVNAIPALNMAAKYQLYSEEREKQGKSKLKKPIVELLFAQEAGIHANYRDKPDEVRANMDRNIGVMKAFTEKLYPELFENTKFIKDKPWDSHDPVTKALIAYAADLIKNHQSPHIKKTLENLVGFGDGKGNKESDLETAINYAAIHYIVWGDGSHIAPNTYFEEQRPEVNTRVRVGSHSEKAFDAMLMEVITIGSREGFNAFNNSQGENIQVPDATEQPAVMVYEIADKIGEHGPSYFKKEDDEAIELPLDIKKTGEQIEGQIIKFEARVSSVKDIMSARAAEIKRPGAFVDQAAEERQFEIWAAQAADYRSSLTDLTILSETISERKAILSA